MCADSGNNKGQHSLLVEAIMHEELRSDQEAINKYVEWQKASHAANKKDKPMKMDEMFNVDNYAFEVYRELRKALTGLVEEK